MSFPDFQPTEIFDEIVSNIILQQLMSSKRLRDHPLSQRRFNRCKVEAGDVLNISNTDIALDPYFVATPLPKSECVVWRGNPNYARQHEVSKTYGDVGSSKKFEFSSALSVLQQRKENGNVKASELFESITRKNKIRKTDEHPELCSNKKAIEAKSNPIDAKNCKIDEEAVELLAEHLGGEVKPDILNLVLSMRLSPSDKLEEKDISGLPKVRKLIREKIINPIKRPDLHFGLHQPPHGILLFGSPGTGKSGKTMLAKWIASESGATFLEVTPSNLISKYYGETETIIHTLFAVAALCSPSVIFIDESDSLLSKRRQNDDDSSIRMKNQLLQMMDGVRNHQQNAMVVVIAATNRPDMLDDAALRRLSKRIRIPLPDQEAREGQIKTLLIKHHKRMIQTASDDNIGLSESELQSIAELTEGWNGSDLRNLCSKAADRSYEEAIKQYGGIEQIPDATAFRSIQYSDFMDALKEVHPSSKLLSSDDGIVDLEEWEKKFGCW